MTRTLCFAAMSALFATPALAQDVEGALSQLRNEPGVGDVVESALKYFRMNKDSVDSMYSRATWRYILPTVTVSGALTESDVDDDTVNRQFDPVNVWVARGINGTANEIRGQFGWELPKLVFNGDELGVVGLAGKVEHVIKEVTRLYYARRRVQVEMILNPPKDDQTKVANQLKLEEQTATIDAMTGGWFGDNLRR